MTDERIDDLRATILRLPKRSGIVFRHYSLYGRARRRLFDEVRKLAKRNGHTLLLADRPSVARGWGADGAHNRSALTSRGLRTAAVHDLRERVAASRAGAQLIFISPVFTTRSHPGARPLSRVQTAAIAGPDRQSAIALGGMNAKRFRQISALNFYGWAGIDAF